MPNVELALEIARSLSQVDGGHHKAWVSDSPLKGGELVQASSC